MDPSLGLQAASGLVSFLLKTTLEWLVCLLLVRFAGSARSRFNLWLTMLLSFVAQWIWMLAGVARAAFPAPALAAAGTSAAAGKRIAIAAPVAGTVAKAMVVLLAVYAALLVWRAAGMLAARVRLARAMRHRSAPSRPVAAVFQEAVEQSALGSDLRCELWVLPGLSSPATLGWWKPRVIIPPGCETQDEVELQAAFWHELKHVERRDALWNAMAHTCRSVLWFHPAVHHAVVALHAQRELACDAAVVRDHSQSRDIYASCLVRFARMRDLAPEPAIPTIEMASGAALLSLRVRSILSDGAEASRIARRGRAAANLALVGMMAGTVPGLTILFAAERGKPLASLSIAGDTPIAAAKHVSHGSAKPGNVWTLSGASLPSDVAVEAVGPISAAPPQDEALAAEHRAAMGVLTESTGMEAAETTGDGRADSSGGGTASRPANATSWGAIAVDAAEHIGPLMTDHDGDGRH